MILQGYSKINIGLRIINKRKDQYHNIETFMVPLKFHDTLDIEIRDDVDDFVTCDIYKAGYTRDNLCVKAIQECRKRWKFNEHFDVSIHKNVFILAGLGGGSADAAACIRGIVKLLKLKVADKEIREICKEIGSDVYYNYYNVPSLVSEIGEKREIIKLHNSIYKYKVFLIKPIEGLSTKDVYNQYDKKKRKKSSLKNERNLLVNGINSDFEVQNDLYEPAIELLPKIKILKQEIKDLGFEKVFMTGSGSTVVGLTRERRIISKAFSKYYYDERYEFEITKFLKTKSQV